MTKMKEGVFKAEDLVKFSDEDLIAEAKGDPEKIGWYERMVDHMKELFPEETDFSKWQIWRVLNAIKSN